MRTLALVWIGCCLRAVAAQEEPQAADRAGDLELKARAELTALAEARDGVATMRCDYVQVRSSALTVEPLRSRGRLLFRRDPPCVVFEVAEPRPARIRLDRSSYQVYEPEKERCERFEFRRTALGDALFDALAVRVDALLETFEVTSVDNVPAGDDADKPEHDVIRLKPRADVAAEEGGGDRTRRRPAAWLSALSLHVVPAGPERPAALRAVRYTDGQGDTVELRLVEVELDPEDVTADDFTDEVPEGTKVSVRSAAGQGPDRRRD